MGNLLEGTYKLLVYSFLCIVADTVDAVLSTSCSARRPEASLQVSINIPQSGLPMTKSIQPSDIDELSDTEILKLYSERAKESKFPKYNTFHITPHIVAKPSQDMDEDAIDATEANALDLVFANTTIPVPRVRRVVNHEGHIIFMDYVKGSILADVWPNYSIWRKMRVAFTLRRYVHQLRQLKAPPTIPPGPFSARGPRTCISPPIFGQVRDFRGPFATYAEFSKFFNKRYKMTMNERQVPEDDPVKKERFDDSAPFVLTHQDLVPRNMIAGEDGRLWIIDWAWAGYYPVWFEYVAMHEQVKNEQRIGFNDRFWELMIPFVCGPYFKQEMWLRKARAAFYGS